MSWYNPFAEERVAAHYEAWYATPAGQRAAAAEKALLRWLLDVFPEARTALEVGCGTGYFTRWLATQGLQVVGLDLSWPMLRQARARCVQGDALRLPFASGAFDLVVMVATLAFLPAPEQALREARRVARQGLVLGVLNRWSLLAWRRRWAGRSRASPYRAARFLSLKDLRRALGREHVVLRWRATLFPWPLARCMLPLPGGGFFGVAVTWRKDGRQGDSGSEVWGQRRV